MSFFTASIGKESDDVFPIKTYKYFEDDPLNNFTNVFGSLSDDDVAVYQIVTKPVGDSWNKHAKNAARLFAKGEYTRTSNAGLLMNVFHTLLKPISWFFTRFIRNE